ncbi:MAG: ribonuclease III domain-containing protein [Oscillospiraceae bacterium]
MSPLTLAFVGDAVFELLVRGKLIMRGNSPVNKLHKHTVELVCASAQCKAIKILMPMLTEEELGMYKRGRNTHNNVPKNADAAEYRSATGLETLFGYLYVKGDTKRQQELFEEIWTQMNRG